MIYKAFNSREGEKFVAALMAAKDSESLKAFLSDIMTSSEAIKCIRRFHIADLLGEGFRYEVLEERGYAGHSTVARISKKLQDPNGGINIIFRNLEEERFKSPDIEDLRKIWAMKNEGETLETAGPISLTEATLG
jgi:uncharacterized protein YerC